MSAIDRRRVTFYCPDRHLEYDGGTPDDRGVGGGVTARLRIAAALARRGHIVDVICNCRSPSARGGVQCRPLDTITRIDTDVLVMHTTGDRLDLGPILTMSTDAARRIVMVDGIDAPKRWADVGMHRLYACSNFIAGLATQQWGVPQEDVFVSHHGVVAEHFRPRWWGAPRRNPFWIAYATHPSKGLAAAVDVLRRLRQDEDRFQLHVFGGHRLWGQADEAQPDEPGLVYHGLLGQRRLAQRLMQCGVALYLQQRLEPFGIAVAEALAAGCITVASDVGAHGEIIHSGATGFLVDGDPDADATRQQVADLIVSVHGNPALTGSMRRRAREAPLRWDTVAAAWEQEWTATASAPLDAPPCARCNGPWSLMADGYHCLRCGYYARSDVSRAGAAVRP